MSPPPLPPLARNVIGGAVSSASFLTSMLAPAPGVPVPLLLPPLDISMTPPIVMVRPAPGASSVIAPPLPPLALPVPPFPP